MPIPPEGAKELAMTDKINCVEFRKERNEFKKGAYDILAIFVDEEWNGANNEVMCYSHNGQHGWCQRDYYKQLPFATDGEYAALKRELEVNFGYRLEVLNKAA